MMKLRHSVVDFGSLVDSERLYEQAAGPPDGELCIEYAVKPAAGGTGTVCVPASLSASVGVALAERGHHVTTRTLYVTERNKIARSVDVVLAAVREFEIVDVLMRALGLRPTPYRSIYPHRNYFFASEDSVDFATCRDAVALGWMLKHPTRDIFGVTPLGREVIAEYAFRHCGPMDGLDNPGFTRALYRREHGDST